MCFKDFKITNYKTWSFVAVCGKLMPFITQSHLKMQTIFYTSSLMQYWLCLSHENISFYYQVNRPKTYYKIFTLHRLYIFLELTVMQHHQQVTMVTSFGLLFRPSSDYASFRIKEKPHNFLMSKWEETHLLDINLIKLLYAIRYVKQTLYKGEGSSWHIVTFWFFTFSLYSLIRI